MNRAVERRIAALERSTGATAIDYGEVSRHLGRWDLLMQEEAAGVQRCSAWSCPACGPYIDQMLTTITYLATVPTEEWDRWTAANPDPPIPICWPSHFDRKET